MAVRDRVQLVSILKEAEIELMKLENLRLEDWDESILDIKDYKAEQAMHKTASDGLREARQFGTDYAIRRDGTPGAEPKFSRSERETKIIVLVF